MLDFDASKIAKHHRKWVATPRNKRSLFDEPRNYINERLDNAAKHGLRLDGLIPSKMKSIASWLGMQASAFLFDGATEGWDQMKGSFLFWGWSERIISGGMETGWWKGTRDLWQTTLPLVHAIATGEDAFADCHGRHLIHSLQKNDGKYLGWETRPFEMFAVNLYAIWKSVPVTSPDKKLVPTDIYQRILDNWHDAGALPELLKRACDFHWRETEDLDSLGHVGAFSWSPYGVFPVEILAIERVRRDQGVPMPEIDHPLMQTPLAHPPTKIPEFQDALLDRIIAKARADGLAGDPW